MSGPLTQIPKYEISTMLCTIFTVALLCASALACADHNYHRHSKRAEPGVQAWAYEASYNWGPLSADYALCQEGTMQAPIPLRLDQGRSLSAHNLYFDQYDRTQPGLFHNWGYGTSMTFSHPASDYTGLPALLFEDGGRNETVYMSGWHIHAPADHSVQGSRTKAELHFVHVTPQGTPRAVLAFRVDPGTAESPFLAALPPLISYRESNRTVESSINPMMAIDEVSGFTDLWTYKGSLTSPPCTEGVRFFVARQILWTSVEQMRDILRVSRYSAREEQQVWHHEINA